MYVRQKQSKSLHAFLALAKHKSQLTLGFFVCTFWILQQNLFDRILDNLTVEIASISINFQPWGRFKTRRKGPWTPPEIQLSFAGIHLVSVNEYGQEAPPEEVWRHNHHRSASGSLLIYKKLSMEYKISIRPANSTKSIPLVTGRDNKAEVHLAMKRRIRDGEWLAVQIDTTIPQVEVFLSQKVIPHLVHALAGISYCVAKDRAFEDPLKPATHAETDQPNPHAPVVKLASSIEDSPEAEDGGGGEVAASELPVQIEEDEASSDEDTPAAQETPSSDETPRPVEGTAETKTDDSPPPKAATGRYAMPDDVQSQPIILLPNGLTISEQLTLSISVYDFRLRGTYAENGYFEVISRGCIGEVIWPRASREKGGYVQTSVSFVTVQEKYGEKLRTLVSGGTKYDISLPLESPGKPLGERGRDETFPLYEDRVIRPDPLGLRYTFPAQAFGLKSTIEYVKKLSNDSSKSEEEEIQVLHETGIDIFDIVLDAGAWSRILRFLANEKGGGFDPRWYSGNWSKELDASMLVRPLQKLNLEECLQSTKEIFLDENQLISSDLFNATCRMTKICLRIPAAVRESLTASEIVLTMNEGMLVVSSALPRTMLSGRIGTSINGDDVETKGVINFPNDPSDVAYQLEQSEDPGDRQRGKMTSRAISTFRVQFTVRGSSVKIVPAVEFYSAKQPQEFLAPTDATTIICFEGEPPETEESNLTKIVLFTSVLAHRIAINFDIELVASAVTSILAHYKTASDCIQRLKTTLADSFVDESETEASASDAGDEGRLLRSIRGRRLLARRQILRSRETGGLSLAMGIQLAEFSFRLWRQCVPTSSSIRPPVAGESADASYLPLLKLMEFASGETELGFEASFKKDERRIVCKGCLSSASAAVCDSNKWMNTFRQTGKPPSYKEAEGSEHDESKLSELFSMSGDRRGKSKSPLDYAAAFRLEENLQNARSWSMSVEVCENSRLTFRPEEIESLATLVFEALMQPANFNVLQEFPGEDEASPFPRNSVGGLFASVTPVWLLPTSGTSLFEMVDFQKPGAIPAKSLDKVLRKILDQIPNNVRTVLIRSCVNELGMFVPPDPRKPADGKEGFCFTIHSLDFLAHYLKNPTGASKESPIFNVIARKYTTWSDIVKRRDDGLFHEMTSTQSLAAASEDAGKATRVVLGSVVVPKFTSGYSYADSRALVEVPSGLKVDGVEQLDSFLFCMVSFRDRCLQTVSNMAKILRTLRASRSNDGELGQVGFDNNPVALACSKTTSSLQSVLNMLDKINDNLRLYDSHVLRVLREKENLTNKARLVSFMREKERLAAYAIVATQKTGWLRIGVASKSGLRGAFAASLWPYWCSLRKGILISYSGPGDFQPLAMVPLEGASLVQLGGGDRKRDLKRAFGLVDSAGALHVLIASSDSEYYGWIHEMKRSISASEFIPDNPLLASEEESSLASSERNSELGEEASGQQQQRLLGRTFSKAVQVAKASKQAVVERRLRRAEGGNDASESGESIEPIPSQPEPQSQPQPSSSTAPTGERLGSPDSYPAADNLGETPNRRQQIRSRFAGVGRGFGSAMQMARQKAGEVAEKGREVAERRRHRHQNESDATETPSITVTDSSPSSVPSETEWSCSACTFANNADSSSCAMCNTPRQTATVPQQATPADVSSTDTLHQSATPQQPTTSTVSSFDEFVDQSNDDDAVEAVDDTPRVGMRQRLGNAVRSVRQNNADPAVDPSKGGGRFGMRRRSANTPKHEDAPEAISVKKVSVIGQLEDHVHPFGESKLEPVVQKRLDKHWLVRVHILNPTDAQRVEGKDSESGQEFPTNVAASADEAVENAVVDGDDGGELAGEDEQQNSSVKVASDPEPFIRIDVYSSGETPDWMDRPLSSVTVPLPSVFALHSKISESVGRLPPPASFHTVKERSESGAPTHSLASAFGLTALDAVRITGTLLSGLLRYHPDSGEYALNPLSVYHGTFLIFCYCLFFFDPML